MSTVIESYGTLYYSPFIIVPLFQAFFETVDLKPKNILLSYLLLPLVLYPKSQSFLKKSKRTSSLWTLKKPNNIYGLPKRLEEYRELTNRCIQLAVNSKALFINDDLSINCLEKKLDTSVCQKNALIAAEKLGKLLSKYDIPTIYRALGVKKL